MQGSFGARVLAGLLPRLRGCLFRVAVVLVSIFGLFSFYKAKDFTIGDLFTIAVPSPVASTPAPVPVLATPSHFGPDTVLTPIP